MKTGFLILSLFVIVSCHSTKNAPVKPVEVPKVQSPSGDEIAALNNLVVSFYSVGGGSDYKAAVEFENYINQYSERTNKPIPFKKIQWGREGEVDYCIELSEWIDDSRGKFIDEVRKFLKGVQVHIKENHPCR